MLTNHGYGACNNAAKIISERSNSKLRIVNIPFPLENEEMAVSKIINELSSKTKLAIIDHVTSVTALVLPVKRIIDEFKRRGIEVLIDGAHAPGMLSLNIENLAPTYYTGNCHKWLCSPKGAAFLYVCKERRESILPPVLSFGTMWSSEKRLDIHNYFYWQGTDDPSAILSVPYSIDYLASLVDGAWDSIRKENKNKVLRAKAMICSTLKINDSIPDSSIGSMAIIPIPKKRLKLPKKTTHIHPFQELLYHKYGIEVPVNDWEDLILLRISAFLYNTEEDYEALLKALQELIET